MLFIPVGLDAKIPRFHGKEMSGLTDVTILEKDMKRFSRKRFIEAGLRFYDYIIAESIFNELDTKEILEIK